MHDAVAARSPTSHRVHRSRRTAIVFVLVLPALLTLWACSAGGPNSRGAQSATATATATPGTPTATAAPAAATVNQATPRIAVYTSERAEIGGIVWARTVNPETKEPIERVGRFTVEDATIYAVLPIIRIDAGVVISAAWTYNNTSLDAMTTTLTTTEPNAGGWLEFHLTRSSTEPWPDGTYAITIGVDGAEAQTAEVAVVSSNG